MSAAASGQAELAPREIRSAVLRLWHSGDRDAAERMLQTRADVGEWRLMLVAARFARAFEADPATPAPAVSVREWPMLVNAIVNFGAIGAARAALVVRGAAERAPGGAVDIEALLARCPPTPPGQAEQEFADDTEADVQVVHRAGATTVLFAFAGGAHRFGAPLRLVHQWFRRLDAHLVYLRDLDGMFYTAGIRSLGATRQETVARLAALARDLGAGRLVCTGNSAGSFGAMQYGLDLGADGVLCFAGPSRIDESMRRVLGRQARHRPAMTGQDIADFDLATVFARHHARPAVRILFSADNAVDHAEAANMAAIPGVELVPFPGADQHGILPLLVEAGRLDANLAWLMSSRPVSGSVSARPEDARPLRATTWWRRLGWRR